nr:MAG TPA: hypothetical protein [Caudoviricetes sp.]
MLIKNKNPHFDECGFFINPFLSRKGVKFEH